MEGDFIQWLRQRLACRPPVLVGLGDDAAVLDTSRVDRLVVTTDLLTDGIDFQLEEAMPGRVGRKALAVNLSDLAAMAAKPLAGFVSLALPRPGAARLARQLYDGILALADEFGLPIAGGDTNTWDGSLVVSVTLLGEALPSGPLRRSGARPGDAVVVTGHFGGSLLGRHFDFTPRVREALLLAQRYPLGAGIDVSDGLLRDLAHLTEESGCGAVVECPRVPVSDDAHRMARLGSGKSPLDHALGDGEDFELILAAAPDVARRMVADAPLPGVPLTVVGQFIDEPGLWQRNPQGQLEPLRPAGYEHR